MAAVAAQYNFWFRVCCFCWLQKAQMYQQAKSSTHHNSRLRYNYFRFGKNKRPPYWNSTCGFIFDHFIVIAVLFSVRLLNFVQIGPPTAIIWRHINFATCRPLLPVSYLLMSLPSKNQGSLPANQISSTYLNSRLRYNYFRFGKTNVRHIGILLSVSISTISAWSTCKSASGCRISSKADHALQNYDVISICFWVMADHPRSVFRGLNSIFKSLVRRINISGHFAMYRFWRFGLKLPIQAPFGGACGAHFSIWRHSSSRLPKGSSLGGNTSA